MLSHIQPTTRSRKLSASPIFYKMKQVLSAKLKLAPTTEQQNLLWDVSLASQDVLNYTSWVAWSRSIQLSDLSGEYTILIKGAVLICNSFFFAPKLAAFLPQNIGQIIHLTSRNRRIPQRGRERFSLQLFQWSLWNRWGSKTREVKSPHRIRASLCDGE